MECPVCGAEVPNGMSVCLECGSIVGSFPKAKDQTLFNDTAHRLENEQKNMLRGLRGPLDWFVKLIAAQVIIYALQLVAAIVLLRLFSDPSWLFSSSAYKTIERIDKLAKTLMWAQIVVTALSLVTLYLMSNYKKGFIYAGLFMGAGVALNLLADNFEGRSLQLWMDIGCILCEIAFSVFYFINMSEVAQPFSSSVADGWKRLLLWYIVAYVAVAVVTFIMLFYVKTVKGVQWCTAIIGTIVLVVEGAIFKLTKDTHDIL